MYYEFIKKEGQAAIQKYTGKEKQVVVPEYVEGLPVTRIAPYAFAEHRQLEQAELPDTVQSIGSHAFYNCRSLKQLAFSDRMTEVGDGALKNCCQLESFIVRGDQRRITGLKHMLDELEQEMEIVFLENRLIFPDFVMDYQENTAARTIHQEILGAGYSYRSAVFVTGVDYREYDQLFYRITADNTRQAVCLAFYRVCWPYQLASQAERAYREFIQKNVEVLFACLLEREGLKEIQMLLQQELISRSAMQQLLKMSTQKGDMQVISLLMDYQNKTFEVQEKDFEL